MDDEQAKNFWHVDLMSVITIGVLLVGFVGGYAELKTHEQMTREGLAVVQKDTQDFHSKMEAFVKRQDSRASQQAQVDSDCPRHRHGKNGEIFYCGRPEKVFSDDPPDDPPADPKPGRR